MDSFFTKGFKAAKCKTLLKLTIPRIKLLRNRREIQIKQMRREIAKLLETGQEATARIRGMPSGPERSHFSVCFAAPRCADLPELLQAQMMFAGKYGKEFVSAATELRPNVVSIGSTGQLRWSVFPVPLPEEKHDETKSTTSKHEDTDSDEDFEIIDFPEVPRQQPLHSNKGTVSTPEMLPFPDNALSEDDDEEEQNPSVSKEDKQFVPFICPPSQSSASFHAKERTSPPSISETENDNVDLQDVLAAAEMAAESAERAATAARSAASIAQRRINELVKKNNDEVSGSTIENPFHEAELDSQKSFGDSDNPFTSSSQNNVSGNYMAHQPTAHPSCDDAERDFDSSAQMNDAFFMAVFANLRDCLRWMTKHICHTQIYSHLKGQISNEVYFQYVNICFYFL
ncbi:hypothetical protein DH2020_008386 [Rehmannia glutinosa]|uniref:Uncharacterized protein n=1 Tax=Rehmannia glutinosa TaxID=99300 RepID=A0ABR0U172_REHGL